MAAGSRIEVEVAGTSASLQEAVNKAAESLRGLGDVLAKQSQIAVAEGDKTLKLNEDLAKSYAGMAEKASESIKASTDEFVAGVGKQVESSGKLGKALDDQVEQLSLFGEALKKGGGQLELFASEATEGYAQVARAAEESAAKAIEAAGVQEGAYERAAAAARASAEEQVEADRKTAAANDETAASADRSAEKQVAAHTRVSTSASKTGSELSKVGKDITLGLLGAAGASTYLAVKFQENTQRLETQAGATAKQLAALRQGMLAMAGSVGFSPDELSAGMYHVVSSMNAMLPPAQRVSSELKILKIAAEGAQVGGSNLEDTTYALASAMNALGAPAGDAGKIMGELNATVGAGDMTMQDLMESLKGGLIPAAKESGISLQSLGAALATMGDEGQQGAIAGTRLRMAIALLAGPSKAAAGILQTVGLSAHQATSDQASMAKALAAAGVTTTQLAADMHKPDGLLVAMEDLKRHLVDSGLTATGAAAVITRAFGGGRTGAGISELAEQTDRLSKKFHQIGADANDFGHDWTLRTHTAAQELHDFTSGIEALGVRIGTDLLPYLDDGVHDLTDFVHWLEQGSAAAHLLEGTVIALASVAIGAYFIGKIQKAIGVLKEFRSFVNDPLHMNVTGGVSTTAGAASSGIAGVEGTGALGGARPGSGPLFSIMNPGVVAIEAGEYAGLSSEGAAGTVEGETGAARTEEGAAQKVVATSPALTPAVETGAAEGVGLAGLKTGLNDLLSSAMKGGMIALGGSLASQIVGSLVKGGAGSAITRVGTDASVGAGIGSVVPGVGTLSGAALGAIYGGIKTLLDDQKSYGSKAAAAVTKGGFGASTPDFTKALTALLDAYKQDKDNAANVQEQQHLANTGGRMAPPPGSMGALPVTGPSQAVENQLDQQISSWQAKAEQRAEQAGTLVAKQLEAGWDQYKFQSEPIMFAQLRAKLDGLPPSAQEAGAASAIQFAQGLEQQGRLAPGSVQTMITEIEATFPGLTEYMGVSGHASASEFEKAIDLTNTQNQLKSQLDQMRGDFPTVTAAMDQTAGDMQAKAGAMITALQQIVQTGTHPMAKQATQDIQSIQAAATQDFTAMTNLVVSKQQDMTSAIKSGSQEALSTASQNFDALEANIAAAWQGGVINTSTGIQDIAKGLNASLSAMGAKPIPVPAALQWASWTLKGNTAVGAAGAGHIPGNATGGYIGAQGERGRDEVLTVLGKGEAVLNHPQQQIANQMMAPIGGLPGLFSKTAGSLHHMATGGFAGGQTSYTQSSFADAVLSGLGIRPSANAIGDLVSWENEEGGNWANNATYNPLNTTMGEPGSFNPGFSAGVQAYPNWQEGIEATVSTLELGSYSGIRQALRDGASLANFEATVNASPWGTHFGGTLGTPIGGSGGAGAAPSYTPVSTPKVEGTGVFTQIAQDALNTATKAANSYLATQAAALAPAAGGGGGAGGFAPSTVVAPSGSKPAAVESAMDSYANSIVGMPYEYGGGHGAIGVPSRSIFTPLSGPVGFDCSGAVSGVLHAGGFLDSPITAGLDGGSVMDWGLPGAGKYVTVGTRGSSADNAHMMINFFGKFLEAGGGGPLGAANVHWDNTWDGAFQAYRHPPGYATGGLVGDWGEVSPQDLLNANPGLANASEFQRYAKSRGYELPTQTDIAKTTYPSKVITPPKAAAIKPVKPPKVAKPKFAHLRSFKLPAGFVSPDYTALTGEMSTKYSNLGNWYGYLDMLYGDPGSAQPTVTITNSDGSQTDEINWGSNAAGTPLTAFTGLADPTTGAPTKGIYDWVRDIGTPPNGDSDKNTPMTLLGVEVATEKEQVLMVLAAEQVAKELKQWEGTEKTLEKLDTTAIGWLDNALDPQYPISKITPDGLRKVIKGRITALQTTSGTDSSGSWIRAVPVTESEAAYVQQKVADYKDQIASVKYLENRKNELDRQREKRDAQITDRFTKYRASISNLSAKQTFDADSWLQGAEGDLAGDEKQALAAIPVDPPAGWVGSKAAWDQQRAQEEADIDGEFSNRKLALEQSASKNKFTGQLKKTAASTKLTLEESSEKTALSTYYSQLGQALSSRLSNDTTTESGDKTYIDSIKSTLGKDLTAATSAMTNAPTYESDIDQYTDPRGQFQITLLELANITIPGLISQEGALLGTTIPASDSTSSADTSAALELAQEIALQAEEEYALSQAQTAALASMIPEIPAYEDGGPTVRGLSMLHDDEYVVPKGGALVSGGGSAPDTHVHVHVHGDANGLIKTIRSEIRNPDNVRSVSKAIGRRTSQLAGAPGGGRGRF
jgi:TP901 family phage tail tape measure protein